MPATPIIRDLFPADRLDRSIEEVIKLDQQEDNTVRHEIEEYVVTDRIQQDYERLLREYSEGLTNPDERVGVWISGFFGSGKSSFAKNLGYILQNKPLGGISASELFMSRLKDGGHSPRAQNLEQMIQFINARIPTHVIMFDVRLIASQGSEPVHQLMYAKLLEDLDYASDPKVAELEIDLEADNRLGEFVRICARFFGSEVKTIADPHPVPVTLQNEVSETDYNIWVRVRMMSDRSQRILTILREQSPNIYNDASSLALSDTQLNIDVLVDRTFELAHRRVPGQSIAFIIDEVGSYVALSVNKIEDLRKVVEHFGQEGANRVRAHTATAPVWVVVTSQEKLDEIVQAIDDKRVELARLQDRFAIKIDMSPSDIREVASLRVLAKTSDGEKRLGQVYDRYISQLKTHARVQQLGASAEITRQEFVQYYPYLPHFIDLSIQIVSGLRSQSGAFKQLGGSNRTIIKQAHEMLVSDRTDMQHLPVGELVTLDRIYDLVEGNLSTEKRSDISDIERRWSGEESAWVARTAKAIALLEYVRGTPRTAENIAALLYRTLGEESLLPEVQAALDILHDAEFIRQTDVGWKLLSLQEKSWSTKRNSFMPIPRDRNTILEEQLRSIFQEKSLARYRYGDLRTFQVDVRWNNRVIVDGREQIPLALMTTDEIVELEAQYQEILPETRNDHHPFWDRIFWLFTLNPDIDEVVAELYRSGRMVSEYDALRSQGNLNAEDTKSLADERTQEARYKERLNKLMIQALERGSGVFRGVRKDGPDLGRRLGEIMNGFFQYAVPQLYPKLELGARLLPKKGQEAEDILKAANLQGLSSTIFYGPPDGLDLVKKDNKTNKWVVNLEAPIAREIKQYLENEYAYGNKVTGKSLEAKFGGIGYGWEQEVLWLVLATLLRGGAIEVTYQGRRYRNHLDPQVRAPFAGANAFRSASFAPRKAPDLQVLVKAAQAFESLTGDEVDVEESAISQAVQTLARGDMEALLPLEATVKAHHIDAVREDLNDYRSTLSTILNSASDDVVKTLAEQWQTIRAMREHIATISRALDDDGLNHLERTRTAVKRIAPMLLAEGINGEVKAAADFLEKCIENGDYFDPAQRSEINRALDVINTAYGDVFVTWHTERKNAVSDAIQKITNSAAWDKVFSELPKEGLTKEEFAKQKAALEDDLLKPLFMRGEMDVALPDTVVFDENLPSLGQMASDIASIDHLRSDVAMHIQQLATPKERIERVRLSTIADFGKLLDNEQDVETLVDQVKARLLDLIRAGIKVIVE